LRLSLDGLYRDLTLATQSEKFDSVHLAEFPKHVENFVNKLLERNAETNYLVISFITKKGNDYASTLQKVMIPVLDEKQRLEIEAVSDLIKAEVNVKEILFLDDALSFSEANKPNFKTLGLCLEDMGLISKEIQVFLLRKINQLRAMEP
jgi:isoleucyl-tRNA synthetase